MKLIQCREPLSSVGMAAGTWLYNSERETQDGYGFAPGGRPPKAVVEAVKAALVSHGVFTVEGASEDERSTTNKTGFC